MIAALTLATALGSVAPGSKWLPPRAPAPFQDALDDLLRDPRRPAASFRRYLGAVEEARQSAAHVRRHQPNRTLYLAEHLVGAALRMPPEDERVLQVFVAQHLIRVAELIRSAPLPRRLTAEQKEIYSAELDQVAQGAEARAKVALARALELAEILRVDDCWTRLARREALEPRNLLDICGHDLEPATLRTPEGRFETPPAHPDALDGLLPGAPIGILEQAYLQAHARHDPHHVLCRSAAWADGLRRAANRVRRDPNPTAEMSTVALRLEAHANVLSARALEVADDHELSTGCFDALVELVDGAGSRHVFVASAMLTAGLRR